MVIVGNAMKRGNSCVEYVLDNALPYHQGPQWLHDHLLRNRWVLRFQVHMVKPQQRAC